MSQGQDNVDKMQMALKYMKNCTASPATRYMQIKNHNKIHFIICQINNHPKVWHHPLFNCREADILKYSWWEYKMMLLYVGESGNSYQNYRSIYPFTQQSYFWESFQQTWHMYKVIYYSNEITKGWKQYKCSLIGGCFNYGTMYNEILCSSKRKTEEVPRMLI